MTATAVLDRPVRRRAAPPRARASQAHGSTAVAFPATWGPFRTPAPRPTLRVVPARTQVRRRRRTISLACGAVVMLLTVVGFHALLAQSQIALDRLERRTDLAERRYENARYEYTQLASPSRITERAAQLGMVPPGAPATPVVIFGEAPPPADAPSTTMNGWTEVKPTLGDSP